MKNARMSVFNNEFLTKDQGVHVHVLFMLEYWIEENNLVLVNIFVENILESPREHNIHQAVMLNIFSFGSWGLLHPCSFFITFFSTPNQSLTQTNNISLTIFSSFHVHVSQSTREDIESHLPVTTYRWRKLNSQHKILITTS